ncbi:L-type lectin-domain containing receptor kinase SIT2-like [Phoenix dactylifera]|uniref:non-specific serine/threonine protein kinase n=1 Tax=Phoenix dactylifera TaxID=42345 RepID=A0A8B7CVJ4_PHODC|nr:L-type lectin-domain containing receptor kinase SIT2-like [Phoenix dactylifera]
MSTSDAEFELLNKKIPILLHMERKLSLLLMVCLLTGISATTYDEFTYNGFQRSELYLDGVAEITPNGLLRLTNATRNQQGHGFHKVPLHLKNTSDGNVYTFSTCFVFAVLPEYSDVGGDGLALVLSPTRGLPGALPKQYLGLFNSTNNGNSSNHVLAIELDTVYNREFGDIDSNHVGIDINGLRSKDAAPASYFTEKIGKFNNLSLTSEEPMQVWIDYSNPEKQLNVTISPISVPKPSRPLLSSSINLSSVILDTMYTGFSSSPGSILTSHYVLGWSFKMNGQAPALNMSSLPSLPLKKHRSKLTSLIVWLSLGVVVFITITASSIAYIIRRKARYAEVLEEWELENRTHRFSYKELFKATKGFPEKNLLGVGGFGRVYKGELPTSKTEIAVKRISHDSKQGTREFVGEIASSSELRHRNLVHLLGYSRRKGEVLLVYEFMPNGSLDKRLYDANMPTTLSWSQRLKIIRGVASGLLYLHEDWEQIVVHRDIKASNVLLDSEMNGKLGDFGLSKLYDHGSDPQITHVVGTFGYIAPELTKTGRATTSTDVFAFGVFILEVVCGRRPIMQQESLDLHLVDWVRRSWRNGVIPEVIDARLGGDYHLGEVEMILKIGLLCSNPVPAARPTMRQVMQFLDGHLSLPQVPNDGRGITISSPELAEELEESEVSLVNCSIHRQRANPLEGF